MDTLEHITPQAMLFFMLYGGAAVTALILCLYMLLGKGNAIAPDITPPVRLRQWAATFFGMVFVGHCYWFFYYAVFFANYSWFYELFIVLDSVVLTVTIAGILLSMLQDRRRPLWPIVAATTLNVIFGVLQIAFPDEDFITPFIIYTLSIYTLFTLYMVRAVREYKRWLLDNYADLEHKEVRLSHTLIIVVLLLFINYFFTNDSPSNLLVRLTDFLLFGMLLWRVETLPQLEEVAEQEEDCLPEQTQDTDADIQGEASTEEVTTPLSPRREIGREASSNIGQLLEKHCVNTKLYLQHDLTLAQLSVACGINRYYLSQYFAYQGQNYNTYINGLRINHFVGLYQKNVANQRLVTAQQLAGESGFRSYSTFYTAFKQRMGQSVTAWIRSLPRSLGD